MTTSNLNILGAAALTLALACGGAQKSAGGHSGGLRARQEQTPAAAQTASSSARR